MKSCLAIYESQLNLTPDEEFISSTEDFLGWTSEDYGAMSLNENSDENSYAVFRIVNGLDDFPKLNNTYTFDRLRYPAQPSFAVYINLS